jgi:hypothetical protein
VASFALVTPAFYFGVVASALTRLKTPPLQSQFEDVRALEHRLAVLVHEWDSLRAGFARGWAFNPELGVKMSLPFPKPSHGLLAPVEDFGECCAVRLALGAAASVLPALVLQDASFVFTAKL